MTKNKETVNHMNVLTGIINLQNIISELSDNSCSGQEYGLLEEAKLKLTNAFNLIAIAQGEHIKLQENMVDK